MIDYEERCRRAATHQGLDPIVGALEAAGIPVVVEQTGGFCMVATVYLGGGYIGITNDYFDSTRDRNLAVFFADPRTDDQGLEWEDELGTLLVEGASLQATVDAVKAEIAKRGLR